MNEIFSIASKISTPLALAGFLAGAFFLIAKLLIEKNVFPKLTQKLSSDIIKVIINRFFVLSLVAMILGFCGFAIDKLHKEIYQVRVTVTDQQGLPVEDAKVWSSIGGEHKQVAGGWQFDIPAASKPKDGKVIFFASKKSAFLAGKNELLLEKNYYPTITIHLKKDTSAIVRGIVVDTTSGQGVSGALVSVLGYGGEAVRTGEDGSFVLPAHAAEGQQVQLRVEKDQYMPVTQWYPAGKSAAEIYLERK